LLAASGEPCERDEHGGCENECCDAPRQLRCRSLSRVFEVSQISSNFFDRVLEACHMNPSKSKTTYRRGRCFRQSVRALTRNLS
jgi:hypothetical protein